MAPVATALSPPETPIKDRNSMGKTHDESKQRMKAKAAEFCERVYKSGANVKLHKRGTRTRVTLTYAQSSDGKISGPSKRMVSLSGSESMIMTHTLRRMHDAILIGVGTLLNDNPQLNTRLVHPTSTTNVDDMPRPIILDSSLRTPLDCKLLANASAGVGRKPLIITSSESCLGGKADSLRIAGAQIEAVEPQEGQLPWHDIFDVLEREGYGSVMIEGGASVIESLFKADEREQFINELIVTVAPVKLGKDATGYKTPTWLAQQLDLPDKEDCIAGRELKVNTTAEAFGKDLVHVWTSTSNSATNQKNIKPNTA